MSSALLMLSRCILVQYLSKREAWLLCCLYQPPPQLNNLNLNNTNKHTYCYFTEEFSTVRYPTLLFSAFQIICSFISVFPPLVQNLLRDTCRKMTDNQLSLSETPCRNQDTLWILIINLLLTTTARSGILFWWRAGSVGMPPAPSFIPQAFKLSEVTFLFKD